MRTWTTPNPLPSGPPPDVAGIRLGDHNGYTGRLARFVAGTRCSDIPAHVREAAKRIVLDTVGCILGAAGTCVSKPVRELVRLQGGGDATVLGTGQRAGVLSAAYANGRLANLLDFDECYMVQGHHAQSTLGAALAICESEGRGGEELLAAFCIGFETGIRFGTYLSPRVSVGEDGRATGWTGLAGPGQGVYAACSAAAHLWKLTPEQIEQAFGLCAQYMAGRDWNRHWGADFELGTIKYADTGWNAQAGMMAALSAREGTTGIHAIFDRDSFGQVFKGTLPDPEALTAGLGDRWSVQNTSFKPWPCCRWIHYPLTAFASILETHRLSAGEIDSVELLSFPMIPYPCFTNASPATVVGATFSFPHAAAMVALGVPAGPDWFSAEHLQGEAASALRGKVMLGIDPDGYDPKAWGLAEGELRVPSRARILARGRTFEQASPYALGDPWPGAPAFDDAALKAKFRRQALTLAPASPQWPARVEDLIARSLDLEQLEVREYVRGFQP